jgi:hypothetical protein
VLLFLGGVDLKCGTKKRGIATVGDLKGVAGEDALFVKLIYKT